MIEAIEKRKKSQRGVDKMLLTQGKENPNKENLGVSVRCFEIYGRGNNYHIYDLIHNKQTFEVTNGENKPSTSSTFYCFFNNNIKQYMTTTSKEHLNAVYTDNTESEYNVTQ
jgi:hypothetical protein